MTKKSWLCPAAVIVLAAALLALALKFVAGPTPVTAKDGRKAIVLAPEERGLILTEMRGFLSGIQTLTTALTQEDMKTVAATARSLGRAATHEVPPALMAKLPLEFKQLGFSVHGDFDQIALDAESLADPKHTLAQLGAVMQKCVGCHATYQLQSAPAAK
jgi:hypothetical protein